MQRTKKRGGAIGISLCFAVVLLYLTVFSLHTSGGGIYARYSSEVEGEDSARVARFEVTETGTVLTNDIVEAMIPGETVIRTVSVENRSEVTVKYSVTLVNLTGNLPLALSLEKISGGETDGAAYDVLNVGETADYNVVLYWPDDRPEDRCAEYSGKIDQVRVVLTAEQTD
ncbi:MAG: hypothetical protein E7446_07850 [Ruminococcaceae bacterium]|nr:hypothetical protein [Oscillospiraceae bacterium]